MCMDDISVDLMEAAKTALKDCMLLKKDETLLVVTDVEKDLIGDAFFYAATELCNEPFLILIKPRSRGGENLPPIVEEAMKKADVVVIPTAKSATHTDARINACAAGARIGTLPGITQDTMERCFKADYRKIAARTVKMTHLLTDASRVHVTSPAGTDLKFSIEGIKAIASTGIVDTPGKFGNLPSGEAYLMPAEGTAEGIIVIDGSIADIGVVEKDDPVRVKVEKGFAVEITGGKTAEKLKALLEPFGREGRNIAEFGVGTNDSAKIVGDMLEDEKVMGTIHFAFGNNKSMGGTFGVQIHVDGLVMKPSFTLDGKDIMKNGSFLVDL
jgi:leucyl aminopeptidase (aminopeptidase T)